MENVIYGDVLFIVNFSMDFLTLYITSKIFKYKPKNLHMVLSAVIGGIYGVVALTYSGFYIIDFLINIAVTTLMSYIAFNYASFKTLLRNTIVIYAVGFLLGGIMSAIYSFANERISRKSVVINGDINTLNSSIPIWVFVILAVVSFVFSYISGLLIRSKATKKTATAEIYFENRKIELQGIVDSGNLLCDPISNLPIIVINTNNAKMLLPSEFLYSLNKPNKLPQKYKTKVRIIPINSVGGSKFLYGFIPDKTIINGENKAVCIAVDYNCESYSENDAIIPLSVI